MENSTSRGIVPNRVSRDSGIDWLRVVSAFAVVLLHTVQLLNVAYTPKVIQLMQVRDFGLRCFTLAMTFLVADQALRARPLPWTTFAVRRADRLLIPWAFWSVFYFVTVYWLGPQLHGRAPSIPPWPEWIFGPGHMYYLVFAYLGCLAVYGVLRTRTSAPDRLSPLRWAMAGAVLLWVWPWVTAQTPLKIPSNLPAYLCWGVAGRLALEHESSRLRRPSWYRMYWAAAVVFGGIYVWWPNRMSLTGYSLSVFVLFVWAPVGWFSADRVVPAAECTFGIYILHTFVLRRLFDVLQWNGITAVSLGWGVFLSIWVFIGAWGLTLLIRRIPGGARLLPGQFAPAKKSEPRT